ncbi:MAG: hypothetical protein GEV09_20950 [Pseudonocardiaceae bacterium]|nr:hypothetical protein [Pseudonocardiaceae bacterium]
MDNIVSDDGQIARLWDHYVQVSHRYYEACRRTDEAHAVCDAAHAAQAPCESAQVACEAAYDEEAKWGRAVVAASRAFEAASDAAFLSEVGISAS